MKNWVNINSIDKVQFNLVNTTSSPITVDLFNLNTLSATPTSLNNSPPTAVTNTIAYGVSRRLEFNPNNGDIYISNSLGIVRVLDSSNTLIVDIATGGNPHESAYNPVNNSMYVTDFANGQVFVIDCATYTLTTTIVGFANDLRAISYCTSTDEMYVSTVAFGTPIQIIDCATNTISSSPATTGSQPQGIDYNDTDNTMYVALTGSATVGVFDCATSTLVTSIVTPLEPFDVVYYPITNSIYVSYSASNQIDVIDCDSNTIVDSIAFAGVPSVTYQGVYADLLGLLYFIDPANLLIYEIEPSTNTITNTLPINSNTASGVNYTSTTNSVWASNGVDTIQYTGAFDPFYIGGSNNYNEFLQNLENEPIVLKGILFATLTQDQLSNTLQIKQKNADGEEYQLPEFPILDVSTYQEQGNISVVKFKDLVMDGRTFFSQYVINANETVVIVLYFNQFNRSNFNGNNYWFKKPLLDTMYGDNTIDESFVDAI